MKINKDFDLIIIGTGLAGYTLAKEWRKQNQSSSLLMVAEGEAGFYSKPQLSTSLKAGKSADDLWVHDAQEMAAQLTATICPKHVVTAINPGNKNIVFASGQVVNYQQAVLAVGADPITPDLKGNGVDQVISINQLEEYQQFRDRLTGCKRVQILGAGLVACEFANDLVLSGHEVSIAAPSLWPLDTLVPKAVGERLQQELAQHGVGWNLGCIPTKVEKNKDIFTTELDNGAVLESDLVMRAAGISPKLGLAEQAGLSVNNGIVVNEQLQTSDPNIYALGDCAEINGHVHQYVAPILHSSRALAQTLLGTATPVIFPIMPIVVKTSIFPIMLLTPASQPKGEWGDMVASEQGLQIKAYHQDGQVCAVVLAGDQIKQRQAIVNEFFS